MHFGVAKCAAVCHNEGARKILQISNSQLVCERRECKMKLYGKGYKLVWEDHFDGPKIDEGYWDILHYNVKGCGGRPAWRKRENCRVETYCTLPWCQKMLHRNI